MNVAEVRFDPDTGLVPAVVQSTVDGTVRMVGYMSAEALERTLASGRVTFYSRSREELWEKGSTSGNWLELVEVRPDCDGDALLVRARPHGPTCHTGAPSCFEAGDAGGPRLGQALRELERVVERRAREGPRGSHTARLLEADPGVRARKVGEEALETVVSALAGDGRLAEESADLLYHLVVLWHAEGISAADVADVLSARRSADRRKGAER
jgi:phosphoribosyl-ATP pyrophosphohydrolase/phosphoribosyl-AMP cyclohydrolase